MRAPVTVDVSILTTAHDVADARLHRFVAVLARRGLSIEVLGLGAAKGAPVGATCRVAPRPSQIGRALRAAALPWQASGRLMVLLDPDLVLPALGRRRLARLGRPPADRGVVVDVHEDYLQLLSDRHWAKGLRKHLARAVVGVSLTASRRADLVIVADDHVPPYDAIQRMVVRNVPMREMLPAPSTRRGRPRAIYVGDVRRSRGLRQMLAAIERCAEWTLDVVGPVAAADRTWLRRWQETSPARDRVMFYGRLPPREAWQLAEGAWAGFSLLEMTPAFVDALPTKILEYLACGLAVITSPLPRAAALVESSMSGVVAADLNGVVRALERWSSHPHVIDDHRAAARSWTDGNLDALDPYVALGDRICSLAGKSGTTSHVAAPPTQLLEEEHHR